ncbi:hypothetical protein ACP4OV_007610 [Aristida adscensionis]
MDPPEREGGGCGGGARKKLKGAAAPAAVEAVSDDVLGEFLVRLPDTADLARAALACKRWRHVASAADLLRRFYSLHEPPLLGFLMAEPNPKVFWFGAPARRFIPAPSGNPHLAAAAAAADCHFKDFVAKNRRTSVPGEWLVRGCDAGLFLLSFGVLDEEELAVYDPIGRTSTFLHRPNSIQFDLHNEFKVHYALVAGDSAASFQVFTVQLMDGRLTGAVFSSRTGQWAALPARSPPAPETWAWIMRDGVRSGRFAYWKSNTSLKRYFKNPDFEYAMVLETTTMEWTLVHMPFHAKESYCIADMAQYGGLCIMASKEQVLQLWARDGNGGWVIMRQVSLLNEFRSLKNLRREEWMKRVRVLAVKDGYVYMEFWTIRKPNSYLLVLNWETMELRVIPNGTDQKYRGPAFPFFMTWAPPLLNPATVEA